MLHGAGIFTNIETPKKSPSFVGKYSSTMVSLSGGYFSSPFTVIVIYYYWLVVWLPFFIFPYIGNNHPIDFHIFQRGSNHQPDYNLVEVFL